MTMASGTGGGGADRVLHRAVVEEVIYDPRTFDFSSPYFYTNLEEGAEPEEGQKYSFQSAFKRRSTNDSSCKIID